MKMFVDELSRVEFLHRVDYGYKKPIVNEGLTVYSDGYPRHTITGTRICKDLGFLSTDEMLEWFRAMMGKSIEITVDTTVSPAPPTDGAKQE